MLTRREISRRPPRPPAAGAADAQPKRIAIITTIYRLPSHGQHMGDRFLVGYPLRGRVAQAGYEGGVAVRRPDIPKAI